MLSSVKITPAKLKFNLHKAYFDFGDGLLSYFKWMITFFGVASHDVKQTLILAVFYVLMSYMIGWLWVRYDLYAAQQEISNQFNPFVIEMRGRKV